jgi:hypothetical protein
MATIQAGRKGSTQRRIGISLVGGPLLAKRMGWKDRDDGPAPINYGNVQAQPFAQNYGGSVASAIATNPNISRQELEQLVLQQEEATARKQQEDTINAYFNDPSRMQRYNKEYDAELNAAKEQLGQNTQAGMRSAAQTAASRGLQGGSIDVENRVGLAGRYQTTLSDLASRRQQASQAQGMQDVDTKTSLLGLVNSADPFNAQATQSRLQGLAGQGRAAQGYIQAGVTRDMADETGANLMSQGYGQGLSSFAGGLNTWQNRQYRQGTGQRGY